MATTFSSPVNSIINVLGIFTILLAFTACSSAGPVVPRQADSADYFDQYIHRLVSQANQAAVSIWLILVHADN